MVKLGTRLKTYDDWHVPHPGRPATLTPEQREANFAAMMQEKPARIATLRAALPELEEAIASLLDPQADPVPAIQALEAWWLESVMAINLIPPVATWWRKLLKPGSTFPKNEALAIAHWDERDDHSLVPKLASMLDDLGLLLGEAVVLRRPDFKWELNHYASEKRADTMEYGRPCVLRDKLGDYPLKAFPMPFWTRSNYGSCHSYKRNGMLKPATKVDGYWYGTFVGWTVVDILDGGHTEDYYPAGPDSERVAGRRYGGSSQPPEM